MLTCLVSAKGSPGCTTTALALAATSASLVTTTLVEADPAGGDLVCRLAQAGEASLLGLASDTSGTLAEAVARHAWPLPATQARVVASPTSPAATTTALRALGSSLASHLRVAAEHVVVDCGRFQGHESTVALLAAADTLLVVCRPTLEGVEHTRCLLDALPPVAALGVLLVGGTKPYGPAEVASALGTAVVGVVAWDPRAVRGLHGHGAPRSWTRSSLAASTRALCDALDVRPPVEASHA